MRYIKIQFTKGFDFAAYQEVSDRGEVVAYVGEDGKEFLVPDGCESHVVEDDAVPPFSEVVRLPRPESEPEGTDTDKETILSTLRTSLEANGIPQNFVDQIVSDLSASL